jgi:hypothetical protein
MRGKAYVHHSVMGIVLTVRVVVLVELKARGGCLVQIIRITYRCSQTDLLGV